MFIIHCMYGASSNAAIGPRVAWLSGCCSLLPRMPSTARRGGGKVPPPNGNGHSSTLALRKELLISVLESSQQALQLCQQRCIYISSTYIP